MRKLVSVSFVLVNSFLDLIWYQCPEIQQAKSMTRMCSLQASEQLPFIRKTELAIATVALKQLGASLLSIAGRKLEIRIKSEEMKM